MLEKRLKKAEEALGNGDFSSNGITTIGDMSTDEQCIIVATINGIIAASRHNTREI